MRKLNVILGAMLVLAGVLFLINDWHRTIGVLLSAAGIVSVISDGLFSRDHANSERVKKIKLKGGHTSYLFCIIYIFLIYLFYEYGVIKDPLNGFILILAGSILIFPITLLYYNKQIK